jgi:hypothetical protein
MFGNNYKYYFANFKLNKSPAALNYFNAVSWTAVGAWRRVRLFRHRRMRLRSSSQVAHSPSRSRGCGSRSGSGSRTRPNRGQADAPPQSAEGALQPHKSSARSAGTMSGGNSSVQIVSQPQLTPPFFHTWLRILLSDSFEKGFYSCFAATSGCYCGWHTAWPRACRNYGETWHCDWLKRELPKSASSRMVCRCIMQIAAKA